MLKRGKVERNWKKSGGERRRNVLRVVFVCISCETVCVYIRNVRNIRNIRNVRVVCVYQLWDCVCVSVKELSGEEVRFSSLNISTRRGRSLLLFSCATRSERTSKNGCVIINFHKTISFLTHPQSDYWHLSHLRGRCRSTIRLRASLFTLDSVRQSDKKNLHISFILFLSRVLHI